MSTKGGGGRSARRLIHTYIFVSIWRLGRRRGPDFATPSPPFFYKCPLLLAKQLQIYRILSMSVYLYIVLHQNAFLQQKKKYGYQSMYYTTDDDHLCYC